MKKLISAIIIMALLTANLFTVAAEASSVAELIAALPEASAITASTEDLRSQIEDINEALIADGLTETDFDAGVWAKWQAVSAKNAYYLPTYDTIDISSAAKSVVFADAGEKLESGAPDYRMDYDGWGSYYAFKKSAMTEIIGADELMYTETGVPFSFPKDYRKAIGEDSQATITTSLAITPKTYRNIAVAATAIAADTKAEIRFVYTDGSSEAQTYTVPYSYNTHGNLAVASSQNNFLHCYPTNTDVSLQKLGGAAAIIGMSWFEFPVDANRELKEIQFLDNAQSGGKDDTIPNRRNYRILAVTGCTDISQAEKDNRTAENKIYNYIDMDSVGNSTIYVDDSGTSLSGYAGSLDLIDWSQINGYKIAIWKNKMTEAVGDDEKVYNRDGVPYSFPKSIYKAIGVKKGVADSVSVNIGKKARKINFLALTGQYSGHGNAPGIVRVTYSDGTYEDTSFTVYDGWGHGQSSMENMVFAPRILYGNETLNSDGSPAANRMGMFEFSVDTDPERRINTIEFKSADTTSNYKVTAITAEVASVSEFETVDLSYPANSTVFADDNPKAKSKTVLGKTDYFDYNGTEKYLVISKSSINELAGDDEIIYGGNVPYSFPKDAYKAIGLLRGEKNAAYVEIPQNKYTNIHFVTASPDEMTSDKCYVDLLYTDDTTETVNFACAAGYKSDNASGGVLASPEVFVGQDELAKDGSTLDMFEVTVPTDFEKTLKGVRFGVTSDGAKYKILALTAEYDVTREVFDGKENYINISSLADSAVTVNSKNLTRKEMSLSDTDYFMYGSYKNCIAVDETETTEYVGVDGIVTDKSGMSYETDMKKAITLRSDEKTITPNKTYAEDIAFIAASGSGADGKLQITFEDGTTDTADFAVPQGYKPTDTDRANANWLCELKKYVSFNALSDYTYNESLPTMGFYAVHVKNDTFKKISSLKFIGTGKEYKILALTVKNYDIAALKTSVETAIASLSQNTKDFALYDNIDKMLETLKEYGITDISGIAEYNSLKNSSATEFCLYMSPDGDDGASGETADAPVKSLDAIKSKITAFRKNVSPDYPIRVILEKGEYKDSFVFDGEWGTDKSTVIFDGSQGAVFTGSAKIDTSAASAVTDTDIKERLPKKVLDKVVEIDLAEQGIDLSGLNAKQFDLYLNGKRQNIAQYPNGSETYAYSSEVVTSGQKGSFKVKDENVANWGKVKENDAYLSGYFAHDWRGENSLMAAVDTENKILTLTEDTVYGVGSNGCFRWKALHIPEELDEPGEWYTDKSKLYYYPPKSLNGATLEIVTNANTMITLNNSSYITFENIHFKNSAGTAIYATRDLTNKTSSSHITVNGCTFTGMEQGVRFDMGVDPSYYWATFNGGDHITVSNNAFLSIGGKAITFYGGDTLNLRPNYSVINNNYIYSTGEKDRVKYPVNLDYCIGTVMRNNIIHRTPAAAVSYTSYDSDIMYNEIYDVLRENEDGGALYSGKTFVTRGNEIAFNVIRDGLSENAHLHNTSNTGVYLDDGLSGQEVHHNIIEAFGCGVLLSGVDNKIYDNTIINSASQSILAKNSESTMASSVMRDAVEQLHDSKNWATWLKHYPELEDIYNDSSECKRNVFTGNLIDRDMYLTSPFKEEGNNTITNNPIYGFRNNTVFDENGLVDTLEGASYIESNTNLLTTENFDISSVGLDDKTAVNTELYKDFELVYPANGTAMDNPSNQLFIWENSTGADEYVLEISETSDFAEIAYSKRVTANRAEVSDFDFDDKDYYWRVRAENISHMLGNSWLCGNAFKISRMSAYQHETLQKQFDISSSFNAVAMLEENETAKEHSLFNQNRLYDPYTMNETFFAKYLDKNGMLHLGGTVFKTDLSGDKKAVNSYLSAVTMDIENDKYSYVDLLIFGNPNESVNSAEIQLQYTDGTDVTKTLNFDTDCIGKMYVQAQYLSTGIVNDYDCLLRAVRVETDNTKTLNKIKLASTGTTLKKSVNVFAITGHKKKSSTSENGKATELYTQNISNTLKTFDVYEAVYDESGKLEDVTKATETFAANEIKSSNVYVADGKVMRRFIWNEQLVPESAQWLSE